MKSATVIFRHEFVTHAPDQLEDRVLYISIPFSTTLHLCPCGCKRELANKISPSRYTLIFDGENVSLTPSIRNTGIPCQSHYFITKNKIEWAHDSDSYKNSKRKKKYWFF